MGVVLHCLTTVAFYQAMARATLACGVDKKDNSLTVRLSEGTKKEFKAAAEARGRSMGWLAVNIIERWLKARRRKRTD